MGFVCMALKLVHKNGVRFFLGVLTFLAACLYFMKALRATRNCLCQEEDNKPVGLARRQTFWQKTGKKLLEASMQRRTLCAALVLYALFPGLVLGAGETPGTNGQGRMTRDRAAKRLALAVRLSLGKPYVWGARGPNAFDCSGLVQWLYRCAGLLLPRTALEQGRGGRRAGQRLVFGDVLLFTSRASPSGWHCGMYLARGYFVHAAGRGRGVIVSRLAPRKKRLVAARRYLA